MRAIRYFEPGRAALRLGGPLIIPAKEGQLRSSGACGRRKRVLITSANPSLREPLLRALSCDDRFLVWSSVNSYDAGVLTERLRPHLILADGCIARTGRLVERLKAHPSLARTKVLVFGEPGPHEPRGRTALPAPLDVAGLIDAVARMLAV